MNKFPITEGEIENMQQAEISIIDKQVNIPIILPGILAQNLRVPEKLTETSHTNDQKPFVYTQIQFNKNYINNFRQTY
tara:strand:- start:640 stop:873 length:234 start_codon:yes stop_codon:yes gene_type:complete